MTRPRDERGAVAITVAIVALVLFGMAAMAVDLGRAYVERQSVQKLTDFAALAGAAGDNLPAATTATCGYGARAQSTDHAVVDVADFLGTEPWGGGPSAAQLVDCDIANGEVFYGTVQRSATNPTGVQLTYNANQLSVISPGRRVDFGFASALGFDGTSVSGQAVTEIRSPMVKSVPLYAHSGCDFGGQTIAQPNHGHSVSGVELHAGSDTNAADLTSLVTSPVTTPPAIAYPAPDPSPLVINGTGLGSVTHVGFFESGYTNPGPEPVTVDSTGFSITDGVRIDVANIPETVRDVQGVWYVRVKIGGSWSRVRTAAETLQALPLTIGSPTLTCGQGPSDGNFGSLLLAHSAGGGQNTQIARNIAGGLEHSLAIYPDAAANWLCSSSQTQTRLWPAEGTNCVETRTGMVADAAHAGFVEGVASMKGRLENVEPGTGCAVDGMPRTDVVDGHAINNDTLSCFFIDDTVNVGMVNNAAYSLTGPVISAGIFSSPRFLMIPVLGVEPSSGGSNKYQIVGFRPAFLTDQTNSAVRSTPPTDSNGLTTDSHDEVESVQVVFLNSAALPPMEATDTTIYAGSGPKVVRLVD
jgi:hypothetical protein